MQQGALAFFKPSLQVLMFLFFLLLGLILTGGITIFVLRLMHIQPNALNEITGISSILQLNAIRVATIVQDVFFFLFPALLFCFLFEKKGNRGLFNPRSLPVNIFLLIIALWVSVLPFIEFLGIWNEKIKLPGFLDELQKNLQASEAYLDGIVSQLIHTKSLSILGLNLLTVGLLTAISEEFIFRGALQSLLIRWIKMDHLAIFIGAFIFSAIHLQFYGFFPRLILGLILGYLYYWSGSIWPGVLFHFINNGVQVFMGYSSDSLKAQITNDVGIENIIKSEGWISLLSLGLSIILLIIIYKQCKTKDLVSL